MYVNIRSSHCIPSKSCCTPLIYNIFICQSYLNKTRKKRGEELETEVINEAFRSFSVYGSREIKKVLVGWQFGGEDHCFFIFLRLEKLQHGLISMGITG